jgi:hypothetical protein
MYRLRQGSLGSPKSLKQCNSSEDRIVQMLLLLCLTMNLVHLVIIKSPQGDYCLESFHYFVGFSYLELLLA